MDRPEFPFESLYGAFQHHATHSPDKQYLVAEGASSWPSLTYRETFNLVTSIRAHLAKLGVGRADFVATYLPNSPEFVLAFLAVSSLGAILVPLNMRQDENTLLYCVNHCNAKLIITDGAHISIAKSIKSKAPSLTHIVGCLGAATEEDVIQLSSLTERKEAYDGPAPRRPLLSDTAIILYTSGTTSAPKGVMWSHGNCLYLANLLTDHYRFRESDRHMVILPTYHINGLGFSIFPATYTGATLILIERYSASAYLDQARKHRATIASLIAMPIRTLLMQPPRKNDCENDFRLGFAALQLAETEWAAFQARFRIPLVQFYGLTEGPGQKLASPLEDIRVTTIGRPIGDTEIRLVDGEGNNVADGDIGEIVVRSKSAYGLMKGYLNQPQQTADVLRGGWLHTGDLAWKDPDGYYHYHARQKDMIKRAGEDIAPAEIEELLESHPNIKEAAVVAVPDALREEAVKAFVSVQDPNVITPEEIRKFCADHLAPYKVPEYIEIVEDFPRDQVGRISKKLLRSSLSHQGDARCIIS